MRSRSRDFTFQPLDLQDQKGKRGPGSVGRLGAPGSRINWDMCRKRREYGYRIGGTHAS